MSDSNRNKEQRGVVVICDYDREWCALLKDEISDIVQTRGIDCAAFTSDADCTDFIRSHGAKVVGYVHYLDRFERGIQYLAGLEFFKTTIRPLTPWARVIFHSTYVTVERIISVLQADTLATCARPDEIANELQWLLTGKHPWQEVDARETILQLDPPWDQIRRHISDNPNFLHTMEPRFFENFVAEVFREYGWEVELTARTRDGGYDVIAIRKCFPSTIRILIEAKRFSPDRPVGVQIVRSLYGIRALNNVSQVVLATSSYVSRDAKNEFSRAIPWELDFLERMQLLNWCKRHGAVELKGTLIDDVFGITME